MTQITRLVYFSSLFKVTEYEVIAASLKGGAMKKKSVISRPTELNKLSFDDLYEEISKNWETKSLQMQDRRWKIMKRAMKEDSEYGRYY